MRVKSVVFGVLLALCLSLLPARAVSTSARAAVLIDAQSKRVLYAQNADEPLAMASTTKIMTALVVAENADLDAVVTITQAMTGAIGTSMYLKVGEQLTVRDLLYGLLLQSGNDAAVALAVFVGGDEATFVEMMNQKARELQLTNTSFANPHGLDAEGHYTTANELALIAAALLDNEILADMVACKSITVAGRALSNHNKMLRLYDGANGIKTGYTSNARRCLVSSATRDGQTLIAVTLNDGNDWNDHAALLDYGFSVYKSREFAKADTVQVTVPVIGGVWPQVDLVVQDTLAYSLTDSELAQCTVAVQSPRFVYATVKKGDIGGWLIVYKDGQELLKTALVYDLDIAQAEVVKESTWKRFTGWVRGWFV